MIVFVAPYPAQADENDGFFQRVKSIDALVDNEARLYLHISFRRFFVRRRHVLGQVTVLQLNFFLHFLQIVYWLKKASVVYIHSVYSALGALPAYWLSSSITDMHGVVPEELLLQGNRWRARLFGIVEWVVVRRSQVLIFVTSVMRQHFQEKYGRNMGGDGRIAILPDVSDARGGATTVLYAERDPLGVIYAGGIQPWQNVEFMMDAAAKRREFRFTFLSGETSRFRTLVDAAGVCGAVVQAVPSGRVPDFYLENTYGFILRAPVLVNQVACPTKLVEYLYWGVIPIVLSPALGDFLRMGFMYVTLDDFLSGRLPGEELRAKMREVNRQVVERVVRECAEGLIELRGRLLGNEFRNEGDCLPGGGTP